MTWIRTIAYKDADGALLKIYDRIKGPDDAIDNIMMAHSLRPHTLEGHMALYKNVLHHTRNTVTKWFLEATGVYTSILNSCNYCVEHHFAGMSRLLRDDRRAKAIRLALESGELRPTFNQKEAAALEYVKKVVLLSLEITGDDIGSLRKVGWEDGEILEINQVTAYFCYANRTVLGLGITTEGDILGLSPGDSADSTNWKHE